MGQIGTALTVLEATKKTDKETEISEAVINEMIETLTREVREHNNFAQRLMIWRRYRNETKF